MMDGQTDGQTDKVITTGPPQTLSGRSLTRFVLFYFSFPLISMS